MSISATGRPLTADEEDLAILRATFRPPEDRRVAKHLTTIEFAKTYRGFKYGIPDFHLPWYEALDNPELNRLMLLAPREHAKTSVVLTYALNAIVKNRSLRIGIVSGTDALAMAFMREITTELENNEELIAEYGIFKPARPKKWTEHEIIIADAHNIHGKDVSIFCIGVGGQITSRHCDILILDDIETTSSVNTSEGRAKTRTWLAKEVIPVLSSGGKAVIIGTRKHYDDIYSFLMPGVDKPSEWHILDNALRAIDEETLRPIWEEMWSFDALMARKRELDQIDVLAWPQEYENRPLPTDTQMFAPAEWPEWADFNDDARYIKHLPESLRHLQAWDLAISQKESADFTAGVDIAFDDENNIYIMDVRFGRWGIQRQLEEFESLGMEYHPEQIGIESVQYQAAAVQLLAKNTMLPVKALTLSPKRQKVRQTMAKDKVSRARLLEARAKLGKVYLPHGYRPWKGWLIEQLSYFPAGAHDDGVDALAYAVTMAELDALDWSKAYGLYTCKKCRHLYILNPVGADGKTHTKDDRPCPQCGTIPSFEDEDEPDDPVTVEEPSALDAPCVHCYCEPAKDKPRHVVCCGCGDVKNEQLARA